MSRIVVDLLSFTGTKGGMETYARELYAELGRMATGHEFVAFASREGVQLGLDWFPGEVVDSGISGENRFAWARGELFAVARFAKRRGADLIHCPATLGPMRSAMPTVVTMHDMLYWSHPEYMSTPLYTGPVKWMERRAAANASRIITDSQVSADEIVKYLGYDPARIDVVHLAAGTESAPVERALAHPPFLLATGARRPHKNWDILIRALACIDEAERPRLVITGGRGADPLQAVVDETGMQRWVELRGWVEADELDELRRGALAVAMPSLAEGFSLTVVEAMQDGMPIMLSDIPVHREVGGDAAHYFDPYSVDDAARAMRRLVADASLADDLVRRGRAWARRYSWERTARETLAVFDGELSAVAVR